MNKLLCFIFGHHLMYTYGNDGGDGLDAKPYTEIWCSRCKTSWGKDYMVVLLASESL